MEKVRPLQAAIRIVGLDVVAGVKQNHRDEEEQQQLKRRRDSIRDKVAHALEDLAGQNDAMDDGSEAFFGQNNVRGGPGRVGGTCNGDTNVSSLQGRSVVDTVTSHTGSL